MSETSGYAKMPACAGLPPMRSGVLPHCFPFLIPHSPVSRLQALLTHLTPSPPPRHGSVCRHLSFHAHLWWAPRGIPMQSHLEASHALRGIHIFGESSSSLHMMLQNSRAESASTTLAHAPAVRFVDVPGGRPTKTACARPHGSEWRKVLLDGSFATSAGSISGGRMAVRVSLVCIASASAADARIAPSTFDASRAPLSGRMGDWTPCCPSRERATR